MGELKDNHFFEVFSALSPDDDMHMMFRDVEVQKVTTDKKHSYLHVYIFSRHVIQKKYIWQAEKLIKDRIFPRTKIDVSLKEDYCLSRQYTLKAFTAEYKESIAKELRKQSVLAANMFEKANVSYPKDGVLCLEMPDSIVSCGKYEFILDKLNEIYNGRFHMDADIRVSLYGCGKGGAACNDNQDVQNEINAIFDRARSGGGEQGGAEGTSEEKASAKASQGASGLKHTKSGASRQNNSAKKAFKGSSANTPKDNGDPNLIYGRNFDDEPISLDTVVDEMGEITVKGMIFNREVVQLKNGKSLIRFVVTDFTDSISVKIFADDTHLTKLLEELKDDAFVKIKGLSVIDKFDGELSIGSVAGIKKIQDFRDTRQDLSLQKRAELHCHTKMSDMDGVSDAGDIIKRAHDWGHPAIAITDHGAVQAFPDANNFISRLPKDDPFKVIYGVEGYVVDDLADIAVRGGEQSLDGTFVVFDLETTGLSAIEDRIIEIGAVKIEGGKVTGNFSTFVDPKRPIPFNITSLTGITDDMVIGYPEISGVLPEFLKFAGDAVLVAHNASFDVGFIEENCRRMGIDRRFVSVDTVAMARVLLPTLPKYKLNSVAKALGVSLENHHRAVDDAAAAAGIFMKLADMLKEAGVGTLARMNSYGRSNVNAIMKMPSFHIIILIKNDTGRFNLYKLISDSHLVYFYKKPRIPKSLLNRYREGLIIGSACEAGELFTALRENQPGHVIAALADFYDYYEIQPAGNNLFMVDSERYPNIHSADDIREINRRIVELGEKFKKPVVATGDVHFLDPKDELYRRIIMAGKGFSDADRQAPLYLRTTKEMLEEFSYLGSEKAREVVIENTNKICDMTEKISPINPNKCPPVIENSQSSLKEACYEQAHRIYGEELPAQVSARLEKELSSIISNGYSVMYMIALKLVMKSNDDGYLVGSRGSVGSSLAAFMAGITEVNPLPPHYYCPDCHYNEFDSPEVKAFSGGCGFDMPDKLCPKCGKKLVKAGFDIPFETFLGFKGDKEPDIDLNFSGDYQAKAHRYTEVLFGEGHTFKAGTIGTLADKTAFGFVKNYFEERDIRKRSCEIDRISAACTGIRRSTGQHPGGIVVLPHGHDINEFTPVQHPANDMESDIITTHFDYHSIDHNLLKLDILGHDDPTMIRALEEYITSDALKNEYGSENPFDAKKIPLDDKEVLSLFHSTDALGITPEDIDGCMLGCLGIPEFGTDFVIPMVQEAKPNSLSDLIRISGLSHGTKVWVGNAQDLIQNGLATISTCICTRDDIMQYLIGKGMDSALAFNIMESVRKGRGLKPEWEEAMKEKEVPGWYMDSCKKISYMFPKAHAAAYVMMAYRIAYCKINYPLAYYAAYFGIRADAFSYELMCQGKNKLDYYIKEYKRKNSELTQKEQDELKVMRIVQEMYARGFEFLPIDIYMAKAKKFQIIGGKIMPSFISIEGMGEKAAETVEEAAKDGPYISLDDFRQRTKANKTVVDLMKKLGLFKGLPESNQLSLFDFV